MEHDFHCWLREQTDGKDFPDSVRLGIGDDGALLFGSTDDLVVTTDTIAEGTHFLLDERDERHLERIGRKLVAVNLSDLAAMGAIPVALTLNFQLTNDLNLQQVQSIYLGAKRLADDHNVALIGGDTNRWPHPVVLSATAIGRRSAKLSGWRLDAACEGDAIVVSGSFGGSIHGRHFDFEPRLALSHFLVQNYSVHAATDASDSLTQDLFAIAKASGLSFQIDPASVPVSEDVDRLEPLNADQRMAHALSDGEDFELLLTMRQQEADRLVNDSACPTRVTIIGQVVRGEAGLVDPAGIPITIAGYVH